MSSSQPLFAEHSPKEEKPSPEEKTMCYAVVAIKSGAAKEKLINYLMNNGFDDMMFVNDLCDHPFLKEYSARTASKNTDRPSTSHTSTDCEEWKTAATQSSAPKLCQVGGPKRTTRRRCVNCYKNLSRSNGAPYARARTIQVNTKCSECDRYFCLKCFQSFHTLCSI